MTNIKKPKEVEEFTNELDSVVGPYMDRAEYGKLRKGKWPAELDGNYHWSLSYDLESKTTRSVNVWYNPRLDKFSSKHDAFGMRSFEALAYVRQRIEQIPSEIHG